MIRVAERIVIVGGGPAALATARAYRAHGGTGSLTIVAEEPLVPYERPPLTKEFLRAEIAADELPIEPASWFADKDVDLRLGCRVTAIDSADGIVTVDGNGQLPADAIVLATGSEPVRPDLPGIDDARVLPIRTRADSVAIRDRVERDAPVVVIGTGFIGCETAASLALRGMRVAVIGQERLPQLARLGEAAAQRLADWLAELDIELIAGAEVARIVDGRIVELADGRQREGAFVVLGTGARPRGRLAQVAGLPMRDGAVVVDGAMRVAGTPRPVLAVGDLAYAYNAAAGRHLRVEHWGDALGHGEVAGRTLARGDGRWDDVPGFWSSLGARTLKYAAWGNGYDEARFAEHYDGGFTVSYERDGAAVGVLTHERDEDYERGRALIAGAAGVR